MEKNKKTRPTFSDTTWAQLNSGTLNNLAFKKMHKKNPEKLRQFIDQATEIAIKHFGRGIHLANQEMDRQLINFLKKGINYLKREKTLLDYVRKNGSTTVGFYKTAYDFLNNYISLKEELLSFEKAVVGLSSISVGLNKVNSSTELYIPLVRLSKNTFGNYNYELISEVLSTDLFLPDQEISPEQIKLQIYRLKKSKKNK